MTSTSAREQRPSPRLRVAAVAALFTFGCTVVRAPAAGMSEVIPVRDGRAEPQLELWIEGGARLEPGQAEAAAARARAALAEAAQGLQAPEDGVLVVRAQGVTRTRARRSDQTRATVALVVGAVVVIVVAVVVLVASRGGGSGSKGAKAAPAPVPHGGGTPASRVTVAPAPGHSGSGGVRPAPLPHPGRVVPAPVPYRPAPHRSVEVYAGVQVDLWNPWYPYPFDENWEYVPSPAAGGETISTSIWTAPPAAAGEALPLEDEGGPEAARPIDGLRLWPAQPLPVDGRGFWARDDMVVELVVVDRLTGEPRLRKIGQGGVDPCDPKAVRKLLEKTLRDGPWERLGAASTGAAPHAR